MEGYRGRKVMEDSKIPKPKTTRLCKARPNSVKPDNGGVKGSAKSQKRDDQPLAVMKQTLERTNSQLENHASEIFTLEEMICDIQEKMETEKSNSKEELKNLKSEKDMLFTQVIELKAEKKIMNENAEKESLLRTKAIEDMEAKMRRMENAFAQLSTQYEEEQLANQAEMEEKKKLNMKIESLQSELERRKQKSGDKEKEINELYSESRAEIEELRSKLVEAETGLQELGKENQALQVIIHNII